MSEKEKTFHDLSKEEQARLMQEYYAGEPVAEIIKRYGLSVTLPGLVKQFPPVQHPTEVCKYCNTPLVSKARSRGVSIIVLSEYYCPHCGHRPFAYACKCKACQKAREQKREVIARREIEIAQVLNAMPTIEPKDIPFREKVYVGAVCHYSLDEKMDKLRSPSQKKENCLLSPTKERKLDIYQRLFEAKIIIQSPTSLVSANNLFPDVYLYENFCLNVPKDKETLSQLMYPTQMDPTDVFDALELWKDIAVDECVEYLRYRVSELNWYIKVGPKARQTFQMLLNDFSVSQIFALIWRASSYAARVAQEQQLNMYQASNIIVSSCERIGARAIHDNWELQGFHRERDLPQSELSYHFAHRVLQIGYSTFTENFAGMKALLIQRFTGSTQQAE